MLRGKAYRAQTYFEKAKADFIHAKQVAKGEKQGKKVVKEMRVLKDMVGKYKDKQAAMFS